MRALKLLAKRKRLAKDAPIACIVKTTGILEDDSLAENTDREALHPLDQFRAFAALREKNQGDEDIAAAFGVTPAVVRQRLKLASASPKLLEAYAADELNLEQLMAFCVTGDHARQQQVFEAIVQREVAPHAFNIRCLLSAEGRLQIEYGFVRPEHRAPLAHASVCDRLRLCLQQDAARRIRRQCDPRHGG